MTKPILTVRGGASNDATPISQVPHECDGDCQGENPFFWTASIQSRRTDPTIKKWLRAYWKAVREPEDEMWQAFRP